MKVLTSGTICNLGFGWLGQRPRFRRYSSADRKRKLEAQLQGPVEGLVYHPRCVEEDAALILASRDLLRRRRKIYISRLVCITSRLLRPIIIPQCRHGLRLAVPRFKVSVTQLAVSRLSHVYFSLRCMRRGRNVGFILSCRRSEAFFRFAVLGRDWPARLISCSDLARFHQFDAYLAVGQSVELN